MAHPSLGDIAYGQLLDKPIDIGSHGGLTHVPTLPYGIDTRTGHSLWAAYVADRGFDAESYRAYGARRAYADFIGDVIAPRFIAWDDLDQEATLASVILSQE
jgi:hypothetical protein